MAVLQESTTSTETEVQSEASFQRLVASHAELPMAFHPRTPRSAKGRFPEEVGDDNALRRNDSDDSDDDDGDVMIGGPSGEGSVADDGRWFSDAAGMDIEMVTPAYCLFGKRLVLTLFSSPGFLIWLAFYQFKRDPFSAINPATNCCRAPAFEPVLARQSRVFCRVRASRKAETWVDSQASLHHTFS